MKTFYLEVEFGLYDLKLDIEVRALLANNQYNVAYEGVGQHVEAFADLLLRRQIGKNEQSLELVERNPWSDF